MEEERVKEEIAGDICQWLYDNTFADLDPQNTYDLANQILSIKVGNRTLKEWIELHDKGKVRIESDDQSLPPNPNVLGIAAYFVAYDKAQEDMLKAGFVKCRPKKE